MVSLTLCPALTICDGNFSHEFHGIFYRKRFSGHVPFSRILRLIDLLKIANEQKTEKKSSEPPRVVLAAGRRFVLWLGGPLLPLHTRIPPQASCTEHVPPACATLYTFVRVSRDARPWVKESGWTRRRPKIRDDQSRKGINTTFARHCASLNSARMGLRKWTGI